MKRFIAEFETQSFTQIIFPHEKTDWAYCLEDAQKTFVDIINAIIKYQKCLVVCYEINAVKKHFTQHENLFFVEYETDDTWARDCSSLCIDENNSTTLLDFTFNGWGNKFAASLDNAMSSHLAKHYTQSSRKIDFVLEGGSIESNNEGIILTTSECLLNKNRNPHLNENQISHILKHELGATDILYLHHGFLAGDDTDSHIDTLARFVDTKTIMYVQCNDENDMHFNELHLMQQELEKFAKEYKFQLIPLPLPSAIYDDDERLPATYANFLFVNGAVLVPVYGVQEDEQALTIFKNTFKDRDVVAINCATLIRQHGSLHCVTMNFASGVDLHI